MTQGPAAIGNRAPAAAKRRGLVVFDLDGTLLDGYAAIGEALAYAMARFGLEPPSSGQVRGMVGHGLERLLEKAVGPARAAAGVLAFRERYPEVAVKLSELLPDVPVVLDLLERAGWRMAVASNKPAIFSRGILEAKGIARYFFAIVGPGAETPPKPDPAMLRSILSQAKTVPTETFVVGDMEVDAQLARAASCRVALVPGGSRSAEELAAVDADVLLGSLRELPAWLEDQWRRSSRPGTD